MFKNMALNVKLVVFFLIVGIVPFAIIGYLSFNTASNSLREKTFNELDAINDLKHRQISSFFEERKGDVQVLSSNHTVVEGVLAFEHAYEATGSIDSAMYREVEEQYGSWFEEYEQKYGYYDLFIIAEDGDVVYTVEKESDLGESLTKGALRESPAGKCFRNAMEDFAFQDFEPYAPSGGVPASFVGAPVKQNGKTVGVVMLQIPLTAINDIMLARAGMGETGESYLVGPDKLMRSDSYLDPENHSVATSFANPDKGRVDTDAAREALSGKQDTRIIMDYNGNPVLSSYKPLDVHGVQWAIMSEMDVAEALAAVKNLMIMMLVIAAVAVGLIVMLAVFIARSITVPINRIIDGLTEGAEQTSSGSNQVSSASQSLAEGAAEQASSLEEVSSSLEEMASMTRQNADNADQANKLSEDASGAAEKGNDSIKRMTEAMDKISQSAEETSKIIKTIDEIAFQTNLLALNAAIEAARAGEAGKGFAVVAEEVRNLAQRAGEAARNTSDLIEGSVKNTRNGVEITEDLTKAFGEIVDGSGKVTNLVGEIAAASKEQAQGIDQVNVAVNQMDKITQQNASNAEESASAAEEMSSQASTLNEMVEQLVGLVGGNVVDSLSSNASRHHAAHGNGNGHHRIGFMHPGDSGNGSSGHKQLARTGAARGNSGKGIEAGKSAGDDPEAMIPMDGEDDFKEF